MPKLLNKSLIHIPEGHDCFSDKKIMALYDSLLTILSTVDEITPISETIDALYHEIIDLPDEARKQFSKLVLLIVDSNWFKPSEKLDPQIKIQFIQNLLHAIITNNDWISNSNTIKIILYALNIARLYGDVKLVADSKTNELWYTYTAKIDWAAPIDEALDNSLKYLFILINHLISTDVFMASLDEMPNASDLLRSLEAQRNVLWSKGMHLTFLKEYIERYKNLLLVALKKRYPEHLSKCTDFLSILRVVCQDPSLKIDLEQFGFNMSDHILPFYSIPTELYKEYLSWNDIQNLLKSEYKNILALCENAPFQNYPLIARSSAAYSEDWIAQTGAWIYVSEPHIRSEADFVHAAYNIYTSVNVDDAQEYRGWTDEKMALVVMPMIYWETWYINVIEWKAIIFTTHDWRRIALDINTFPIDITKRNNASPSSFSSLMQNFDFRPVPAMWTAHTNSLSLWNSKEMKSVFTMVYILFKKLNYPWLQFEVVKDKSNDKIYIVQMRSLPRVSEISANSIPSSCSREYAWAGNSNFPFNGEVSRDKILFLENSNWATSDLPNLKNYDAVIITNSFWCFGHIETLCGEEWTLCITNPQHQSLTKEQILNLKKSTSLILESDSIFAQIYTKKIEQTKSTASENQIESIVSENISNLFQKFPDMLSDKDLHLERYFPQINKLPSNIIDQITYCMYLNWLQIYLDMIQNCNKWVGKRQLLKDFWIKQYLELRADIDGFITKKDWSLWEIKLWKIYRIICKKLWWSADDISILLD